MGSNHPLIISFYTDDWTYPQHADRLRGECDRLGLAHHIERRPSAGGYLENTCQKPTFILECLQRYGRPLFCTEYMARGRHSTFQGILPLCKKYNVAAYNWGQGNVGRAITRNHLDTCVADAFRSDDPDAARRAADEVMTLIDRQKR